MTSQLLAQATTEYGAILIADAIKAAFPQIAISLKEVDGGVQVMADSMGAKRWTNGSLDALRNFIHGAKVVAEAVTK